MYKRSAATLLSEAQTNYPSLILTRARQERKTTKNQEKKQKYR
jgi:hypothetical protein